jgi:hypothetical protein
MRCENRSIKHSPSEKDIIKALECCIKLTSDCDNCPLYIKGDGDCIDISKQGALDIISRKNAIIKEKDAKLKFWMKKYSERNGW